MDDSEEYEMKTKVVLVGDSGVGKSNIMNKFLKNQFMEDSKATVGVDFGSKLFVQQGHKIKAQIWDTSGQERYKNIISAYYRGLNGALVIYDITHKDTFANIERWVNDLKAKGDPKITIIIIGNKNDLQEKREVSKEQGEEKAKSLGCAFLETSAFSGDNIEKAFEIMVKEIYPNMERKNINNSKNFKELINDNTKEKSEEKKNVEINSKVAPVFTEQKNIPDEFLICQECSSVVEIISIDEY